MLINWKEIPFAPGMRAGSERQGICGDKVSAVRVVTTPDAVFDGKTHWHDNEQLLVMLSGMVRLVIDGKELEAHPGDLVFLSGWFAPRRHWRWAGGRGVLRDLRTSSARPTAGLGRKIDPPI